MKYVVLVGLIALCIVLTISLIRNIVAYVDKRKEAKKNTIKEDIADVSNDCNRDD